MTAQHETTPAKGTLGLANVVVAVATDCLTRRFGDTCAVDTLTLRVPPSSVYAFLGPNGAGKSTTIRMLLGLTRPDSGEVHIFGAPMNRNNRRTLLRRIGSMVERPSLYPHLTGYENLQVAQKLILLKPSSIDRVLRIVRLEGDAHRLVKTYSQGMRQRLAVAMALLPEPDLLILDEPTNGLDPACMIEMRELVRSLPTEQGITVFLSSHLLAEVEQIASHVGIIGRGRLLFEGTLEKLQSRRCNRILIETDRPVIAAEVLLREGWRWEIISDSALAAELPGRESVACAASALISAGVRLYQIQSVRPSLEDLFLDLTREVGLGSPSREEVSHD